MNRNQQLQDKFITYGLKSFEDVEVLELLLGIQLDDKSYQTDAQKLLKHHSSLNEIIDASLEEPNHTPGFLKEYLFGLRFPHELANRYLFQKATEKPILDCADAVLNYLRHSMRGLKKEHFKVLYLNGRNMLMAEKDLAKGTLTNATVYPREVIKSALKNNAAALVFAHNHVSGNPRPSKQDMDITNRLYQAADLFDITVHDHIIIADHQYFSFAESGYLDANLSSKF